MNDRILKISDISRLAIPDECPCCARTGIRAERVPGEVSDFLLCAACRGSKRKARVAGWIAAAGGLLTLMTGGLLSFVLFRDRPEYESQRMLLAIPYAGVALGVYLLLRRLGRVRHAEGSACAGEGVVVRGVSGSYACELVVRRSDYAKTLKTLNPTLVSEG